MSISFARGGNYNQGATCKKIKKNKNKKGLSFISMQYVAPKCGTQKKICQQILMGELFLEILTLQTITSFESRQWCTQKCIATLQKEDLFPN